MRSHLFRGDFFRISRLHRGEISPGNQFEHSDKTSNLPPGAFHASCKAQQEVLSCVKLSGSDSSIALVEYGHLAGRREASPHKTSDDIRQRTAEALRLISLGCGWVIVPPVPGTHSVDMLTYFEGSRIMAILWWYATLVEAFSEGDSDIMQRLQRYDSSSW